MSGADISPELDLCQQHVDYPQRRQAVKTWRLPARTPADGSRRPPVDGGWAAGRVAASERPAATRGTEIRVPGDFAAEGSRRTRARAASPSPATGCRRRTSSAASVPSTTSRSAGALAPPRSSTSGGKRRGTQSASPSPVPRNTRSRSSSASSSRANARSRGRRPATNPRSARAAPFVTATFPQPTMRSRQSSGSA